MIKALIIMTYSYPRVTLERIHLTKLHPYIDYLVF